ASGERIADAIGYALSQRNNHALSEAVGLVVLGLRLQEVHPEASVWAREGVRLLEKLVPEQFAEDGWYLQHSFNYLRLALDQLTVAGRIMEAAGVRLSEVSRSRIVAAVRLLSRVVEPSTGIVPNH